MENIRQQLLELWEKEYPEQDNDFIRILDWVKLTVPITSISCNDKPRNIKKARKYLSLVKEGTIAFPPLICINGEVIDGYHRFWAYKKAGFEFVTIIQNRSYEMQEAV